MSNERTIVYFTELLAQPVTPRVRKPRWRGAKYLVAALVVLLATVVLP